MPIVPSRWEERHAVPCVCPASRRLIGLAGVCQVALPCLPSAPQQHHMQTRLDCDRSVGVESHDLPGS